MLRTISSNPRYLSCSNASCKILTKLHALVDLHLVPADKVLLDRLRRPLYDADVRPLDNLIIDGLPHQ